jgi:predicted membrane protein (TIGR00267 family)
MRLVEWLLSPRTRLDLVAGVVDGVLTALVLTAARLLEPEGSVSVSLALRISAAAGATTVFVFFVAHYADLRTSLIRAERQLNVLRHGRLARSRLGRQVFYEALAGATLAACSSVIGALLPMLAVVTLPDPPWLGCALTIVVLGALGVLLARSFYGSTVRWALALMVAGTALTLMGAWLRIA